MPINILKGLVKEAYPLYAYSSPSKKGMLSVSWLLEETLRDDHPSIIGWICEHSIKDGKYFKGSVENPLFLPKLNKIIMEKEDVQEEITRILKGISLNTERRGGNWVPLLDLRSSSIMEFASINRSPSPTDIFGMFYILKGVIDFPSFSPLISYRCFSPSGAISLQKDLVLKFIKYLQ